MGCNNSKRNFSELTEKRDKLLNAELKHGDKLNYNENEVFFAINKAILVFDVKSLSNEAIDYVVDYEISCKVQNFNVILLNWILRKLIFNTDIFDDTSKLHVDPPFKYGLLNYDEVLIITADDKKLHAFFIKQADSTQCLTFLYLHGNSGNIGYNLRHAKMLYLKLNCNILLIDYRGYGYSKLDGKDRLSENTCYLDAKAGLDFLSSRQDIDLKRICVLG